MRQPQQGYPGIQVKDLAFGVHPMAIAMRTTRSALVSASNYIHETRGQTALLQPSHDLLSGFDGAWACHIIFENGVDISIITTNSFDVDRPPPFYGNAFIPSYEIEADFGDDEPFRASHLAIEQLQDLLDQAGAFTKIVRGREPRAALDDVHDEVMPPVVTDRDRAIYGSFRYTATTHERELAHVAVPIDLYRSRLPAPPATFFADPWYTGSAEAVRFFNIWCAANCVRDYSWVGFYPTWAFAARDDAQRFEAFLTDLTHRS